MYLTLKLLFLAKNCSFLPKICGFCIVGLDNGKKPQFFTKNAVLGLSPTPNP